MKTFTTLLTVLAAGTTLALAQDTTAPKKGDRPGGPGGRGGNPEEFFKKLDSNNDGGISLDEFKASPRGQKDPAQAEEHFKKLDTNSDGKVSLDELKAGHHGRGDRGGKGGKPEDKGAPKA